MCRLSSTIAPQDGHPLAHADPERNPVEDPPHADLSMELFDNIPRDDGPLVPSGVLLMRSRGGPLITASRDRIRVQVSRT